MTFKTILLPVEKHDQIGSVFRCAADFAKLWGAYLEGAPVRSLITDIYIAGAFGGVPIPQMPAGGTTPQELRRIGEAEARRLGLTSGTMDGSGVRFGWRDIEALDDI
jgi:hypothetical protein